MGEVVFFRSNGSGNSNTSIIIPSMYEQHWEDTFDKTELLFDINEIYALKGFPNVMSVEFIVENISLEKELSLIVKDEDTTLINVFLEAEEVQKYELGISSHIKVYINGSFTASLYIGTY